MNVNVRLFVAMKGNTSKRKTQNMHWNMSTVVYSIGLLETGLNRCPTRFFSYGGLNSKTQEILLSTYCTCKS